MFVYNKWEWFCKNLKENGIYSISAKSLLEQKKSCFLILKHDVETNPKKALQLAKIEAQYGHSGVYYVQAYLLDDKDNVNILKQIQDLGHEVSYHHDVMDSTGGNIDTAIEVFEENKDTFEKYGLKINTVCQHGNPIVKRVGYSSNRDFFRNSKVREKYSEISEIMVDFKDKTGVDYKYISDAGYGWKLIFDPENNDIVNSDDKNILLGDLKRVIKVIKEEGAVIVSTHPHRWQSNMFTAILKRVVFSTVRLVARIMKKIPIFKRLMEKYYYIAKKI